MTTDTQTTNTDNTTLPTTDTTPPVEGQATSTSPTDPVVAATPADPNAPVVAPQYTPNFKYKFLSGDGSNRVEKEFEEWMRPLVKDADTEKKLRELHERAYGLDFVKSDRQKQKERADMAEGQFGEITQKLQKLGEFKAAGDFDSFFEMLDVSEDDFLKHAVKVAQRRQNPQAQEVYNQQRQAARQAMTLEQENAQLRQQQEQYAVQMRTAELEGFMSRQDIAPIAQSFDDRVGVPGAFRAEVIKRGQYHHAINGQDISVEQAVGEVLALIGSQPGQATQPVAQPPVNQIQGAVSQPKPVIPHINGKGTSPTKRIAKSTEELRQLAASMSAE